MTSARIGTQQAVLSRWVKALDTEAFKRRGIGLSDLVNAAPIALEHSCQRLIQAMFREKLLDSSALSACADGTTCLAISGRGRIRFDSLKSGPMGSWTITGKVSVENVQGVVKPVELPSDLLELIYDHLTVHNSNCTFARIESEINDSFANDILCIAFQRRWASQLSNIAKHDGYRNTLDWLHSNPQNSNPTALLEQWGTLGHPWHPNYKTKLGLDISQIIDFSPEFEARLPVMLAALRTDVCYIESMDPVESHTKWWQQRFPKAAEEWKQALIKLKLKPDDYTPIPVHPWQATTELPNLFPDEIRQHMLVITDVTAFTGHPTMSFRTVIPDGRRKAPLVKLPVSLRLTSVQRTISPRSVRMGPRVSRLLQEMHEIEPTLIHYLKIISERVGIQYEPAQSDDDRARHIAAIFRDNPADLVDDGELAIPVGSLFAMDASGRPLLEQWIELRYNSNEPDAALKFYKEYISMALHGLLGFYLIFGVAFEAHQQNSFVILGTGQQPSKLLIRDFGDIRIDRQAFNKHALNIQLHDPHMTLFDDSNHVRDKFIHTTLMCHIGELSLLCARQWRIPHAVLWNALTKEIESVFYQFRSKVDAQRWEAERQAILFEDWPAKAFLRMRLEESSKDIVERIPNPLRTHSNAR